MASFPVAVLVLQSKLNVAERVDNRGKVLLQDAAAGYAKAAKLYEKLLGDTSMDFAKVMRKCLCMYGWM